jgi:hypothetical protein
VLAISEVRVNAQAKEKKYASDLGREKFADTAPLLRKWPTWQTVPCPLRQMKKA